MENREIKKLVDVALMRIKEDMQRNGLTSDKIIVQKYIRVCAIDETKKERRGVDISASLDIPLDEFILGLVG